MASHLVDVDTAELAGSFLETILYGILFIVGNSALYLLRERSKDMTRIINILLSLATLTMITLGLVHLSVDARRVFNAFFKWDSHEDRVTYLGGISTTSYAAQCAVFITQTLVGDVVLMFMLYAVWERIWVAVFPSVLALGSGVPGYAAVYKLQHASSPPRNWVHAFIALTLAVNVIATSLIAGRIVWSDRKKSKESLFWSYVSVFLESGALNTVTFLAYEICYAVDTNVLIFFNKFTVPITGLAYSLLICRVYSASRFFERPAHAYPSQPDWGATMTSSAPGYNLRSRGIITPRESIDDLRPDDSDEIEVVKRTSRD